MITIENLCPIISPDVNGYVKLSNGIFIWFGKDWFIKTQKEALELAESVCRVANENNIK